MGVHVLMRVRVCVRVSDLASIGVGAPLKPSSRKGTLPNSLRSDSALVLLASKGVGVAHPHSLPPSFLINAVVLITPSTSFCNNIHSRP